MGATIRFDPQSGVPAIRQIADNLRILLVEEQVKPGAQLPSIRRLAMELGVHFSTVAEAYRELAAEGWLDLKHGRGAMVLARSMPPLRGKAWLDEFRSRLGGLIAQTRSDGAPSEEIAEELRSAAKEMTPCSD
jgi:GntR family transcriptional regulator